MLCKNKVTGTGKGRFFRASIYNCNSSICVMELLTALTAMMRIHASVQPQGTSRVYTVDKLNFNIEVSHAFGYILISSSNMFFIVI